MKKLTMTLAALLASAPAWAQEVAATTTAAATGGLGDKALYAVGAGLILGMAALGGTLAQGKIGSAAMDGIARNPQAGKDMFTPMMIGLALVESLVIVAFVMAFLFQGKM
jgi:F-type H+-transporting ATPase subunit c